MRKYLLILITILIALVFCIIVLWGIKIGKFRIYSYDEILATSKEKNALLSALDSKNIGEYDKTLKSLQTAVQTYENTKSEYNKLVQEGKIADDAVYNSINLYEIEALSEKIKNYAKEKNVVLTLDVIPSATSTSISSAYIMCDLDFKISGEYISITDFLYSIEDDDTLGFEIKDFSLNSENGVLKASFSAKNIPISSQSLSN